MIEVRSLTKRYGTTVAIAQALVVSAGTVEKHVARVFGKLGLPPSEDDNGGYWRSCAFCVREGAARSGRVRERSA